MSEHLDLAGVGYAVLSGAIASGAGYVIWYTALPLTRENLKVGRSAPSDASPPFDDVFAVFGWSMPPLCTSTRYN